MNEAQELLDSIKIIVEKELEDISNIYIGNVVSVSTNNKCTVMFNGKQYDVTYYGGTPTVNKNYPVFVPQGNMANAFLVSNVESGSGGTTDHRNLTYRDANGQHPMSAITDLVTTIEGLVPKTDYNPDAKEEGIMTQVVGKDANGRLWTAPTGGGGGTMNIHGLTAENDLQNDDETPFYDASVAANRKTTWSNIVAKIKGLLSKSDVGLSNVDNVQQYSASNKPTANDVTFNSSTVYDNNTVGKEIQSKSTVSITSTGSTSNIAGYINVNGTVSKITDTTAVHYTADSDKTAEEKAQARSNIGAYARPSDGIPSTDMTTAVQASLSKADSAVQLNGTTTNQHFARFDVNGKIEDSGKSASDFSKVSASASGSSTNTVKYLTVDSTEYKLPEGVTNFNELNGRPSYAGSTMTGSTAIPEVKTATWDAKYTKPALGIPFDDLYLTVQNSLIKADDSVQKPSGAASGSVPTADGNGGYSWQAQTGPRQYLKTAAVNNATLTLKDHNDNDISFGKTQLGLNNVVNTGDSATPTQNGVTKFTTGGAYTELNKKADKSLQINGHALSGNFNITKSDIGLGDVVNTGDSDTPVQNGTTKFTTGGAYTELNKKADKVANATADNFVGLNNSGNLVDSGYSASSFVASDKYNPIVKTEAMTQDVGVDESTGKLYTTPPSGSDSNAVHYSPDNGKSDSEKTIARGNINAAEINETYTAFTYNQFIQNGNFVNTSGWTADSSVEFSVTNNRALLKCPRRGESGGYGIKSLTYNCVAGHTYYYHYSLQSESGILIGYRFPNGSSSIRAIGSYQEVEGLVVPTASVSNDYASVDNESNTAAIILAKNIMVIDLTLMYGAGNEPTTVAQFRSMFPDNYYAYNTGETIHVPMFSSIQNRVSKPDASIPVNYVPTSNGSGDYTWQAQQGGSGLDIHGLTAETDMADADEMPFYDSSASGNRKTTWSNIVAKIKATFTKSDVGLSNVDNVQQYSANNPPPYPVTSVNNKTGIVTLDASDIGLGSVANTGDSDTPVSGGTTKFTTGGAYTELNKKAELNEVYSTVVYNQLVPNGNFVDTSNWTTSSGVTFSVSGNKATVIYPAKTSASVPSIWSTSFNYIANHKYYYHYTIRGSNGLSVAYSNIGGSATITATGSYQEIEGIKTVTSSGSPGRASIGNDANEEQTIIIKNVMIVDLTAMFGEGQEPTVTEFRLMFPDEYLSYSEDKTIHVPMYKAIQQRVSVPPSGTAANYVPTSNGNGGYTWAAQQGGSGKVFSFEFTTSGNTATLSGGTTYADLVSALISGKVLKGLNSKKEFYLSSFGTPASDPSYLRFVCQDTEMTADNYSDRYQWYVRFNDDGTSQYYAWTDDIPTTNSSLLKSNNGNIVAATAGEDYVAPSALTTYDMVIAINGNPDDWTNWSGEIISGSVSAITAAIDSNPTYVPRVLLKCTFYYNTILMKANAVVYSPAIMYGTTKTWLDVYSHFLFYNHCFYVEVSHNNSSGTDEIVEIAFPEYIVD